jgi:hypothetical protein
MILNARAFKRHEKRSARCGCLPENALRAYQTMQSSFRPPRTGGQPSAKEAQLRLA